VGPTGPVSLPLHLPLFLSPPFLSLSLSPPLWRFIYLFQVYQQSLSACFTSRLDARPGDAAPFKASAATLVYGVFSRTGLWYEKETTEVIREHLAKHLGIAMPGLEGCDKRLCRGISLKYRFLEILCGSEADKMKHIRIQNYMLNPFRSISRSPTRSSNNGGAGTSEETEFFRELSLDIARGNSFIQSTSRQARLARSVIPCP